MSIKTITGSDAVETAMKHVESFLDDPDQKVFQILGYYGIGKRKALKELFEKYKIKPILHKLTIVYGMMFLGQTL